MRAANRLILLSIALLVSAGCADFPKSPGPGTITDFAITSPVGDYVFTNKQVNIYASIPSKFQGVAPLSASVGVEGAGGIVTLAEGDLRSMESFGTIVAVWDPKAFALGDYVIRVEAELGGRPYRAERKVELRDPPNISVRLKTSSSRGNSIVADFEAVATSASPAEIVSYRWNFGDEVGRIGPSLSSVSHVYRILAAEHEVSVEVTDNLGGTNYSVHTVQIAPNQQPPIIFQAAAAAGCGCRTMLIDARPNMTSSRFTGPALPGAAGIRMVQVKILTLSDPAGTAAGDFLVRAELGNLDPAPPGHRQMGNS